MKKINKNKIIIIAITIVISIISYINYFPEYYSIDTTKIIEDGYKAFATEYSIQDGRIFSYIIFYIAEVIGLSVSSLWRISAISAIVVSSISVLKLYNIITKIKPMENKKIKVMLYLIVYSLVFNFMYVDCIEFAECLIMAFSVLFYIKSAEEIILKNQNIKGLIYCIIGILFYQGTLNVFITLAILFLIISPKEDRKKTIKKLIITGIIAILVVGLDFLLMNIIKSNMTELQAERLSWNLLDDLKLIKKYLPKLIVNSVELFPKYLQIVLTSIILVMIFIKNIQEKKPLKIILPICLILVCYITSLVQTILTPDMLTSINGRMFLPTGMLISVVLIYAYTNTDIFESKILGKIIDIFIVIYFIINIASIIYTTGMLKEGNNIDREISYEIQQAVAEYEKETQNEIKYIAIMYPKKMESDRKSIRSRIMMKEYNSLVYKTYTGEELEDRRFEMEIRIEHFKDKTHSVKCIEDTVYVYM